MTITSTTETVTGSAGSDDAGAARAPSPIAPTHTTGDDHLPGRAFRSAVWLLPIAAAVTAWATFEHQPDPDSQFTRWSQFVTTDRFLASHLVGSILGQAIWIMAAAAITGLAVVTGRRAGAAIAGFVAMVLGGAGLIAGFGVAAFAQPAIGHMRLDGVAGAHALYDDVYGLPTFVTLIGGSVLFAASTVLLARALAAMDGVPGWAAILVGVAGPLIGVLGVAIGTLQTVGSIAALLGGLGVAVALRRRREPADLTAPDVTGRRAPGR